MGSILSFFLQYVTAGDGEIAKHGEWEAQNAYDCSLRYISINLVHWESLQPSLRNVSRTIFYEYYDLSVYYSIII